MPDSPTTLRANWIVLAIVVLVASSLGLLYLGQARRLSQKLLCQQHLEQVAQGLAAYEQANGLFMAERYGSNFGYRVPLLPFIDQQPLYDQIRSQAPDGVEFNDILLQSFHAPACFRCPVQPPWQGRFVGSQHSGNYFLCLGQGIPQQSPNGYANSRDDDLVDGKAFTVALAEFLCEVPNRVEPRTSGYIYYLSGDPNDLSSAKRDCFASQTTNPHRSIVGSWVYWEQMESSYIHALTPNQRQCVNMGSPSSDHSGGVHLAFADGSIRFLANSVDPHIWWGFASRDGDKIGPP